MKTERFLYLGLCLGLFVYILFRIIQVPLTHDEVATYVHFVLPGEFIPGQSHLDANNHYLNSFLSILAHRLFGLSPLSLRLANLIGFIVLAFYTWKLSSRFNGSLSKWAFILSLLGSHYLMEFYGLSRGYGLAMAFFIGLLYHIHKIAERPFPIHLLAFNVLLFFCLSSSLTFLFPALILYLISLYFLFRSKPSIANYFISAIGAITLGVAIKTSLWLKEAGALYYGSEGSFWEKTINSLSLLLGGDNTILPYVFAGLGLALLFSLFARFRSILRPQVLRTRIFHISLFGSICGIILSHYLLGTHYPEDRVAIYLYPLFIGAFLFSINDWAQDFKGLGKLALILFLFPIHFLINMNLSHVDFLFRERVPDEFYDEIEAYYEEKDELPTLSGYETSSLTYFMKGFLEQRTVPALIYHDFPNENADFILTRINEDSLEFKNFDIVAIDEASSNKLWKRKNNPERVPLERVTENVENHDAEFLEFMRLSIPADSHYVVEASFKYSAKSHPLKSRLVVNLKDSLGKELAYIPFELDWRYRSNDEAIQTSIPVSGEGEGRNELVIYLWNVDKGSFDNLGYDISLSKLAE